MTPSLEKTLKLIGGVAPLARALAIKYQAVQQWKKIPPKRALKIEEITGGEVTAREILEEQR